ncbi:MAG: endo-1,4-beta-xylanase, partial [Bacteroidia bacterium]|nr:endo-1,4-beta-xylanase [Bacteroidia bacterium]
MKQKIFQTKILLSLVIAVFQSCSKSGSGGAGIIPPVTPPVTTVNLKDLSSVPIGVGISYDLMKNNSSYSSLVKAQFDRVTAEYQMKHGPNVRNDGSFDFTKTDDFFAITQAAGLTVHGHTLVWHANNNGNYLRSLSTSQQVRDALRNWITTMVTRYKGKVTGWDVANEVVVDGLGNLRTSSNSSGSGGDYFYWADYLGRSYIDSAFFWANAADPSAKLFINDYNLETDNRKLDSVIAIINSLKAASIPIHGVGLQMHISINTNTAGIDAAFQKLAATGLLIHVSEMDVRINPSNTTPFSATSSLLDQQAAKYRYVAESYFRNVPVSQRYGITMWNLTDADSWIVTGGKQDAPTLFYAG